jgi:hypothetical protein
MYEYAAVGPEYRNPACGEMHALGTPLPCCCPEDEDPLSRVASANSLVNRLSNSMGLDVYHDPA